MNNLEIYDKVRSVPAEAQKTIKGGRLSGFTEINPMWRIKALTEQFGPVGIGWYTEIVEKWTETQNGETAAFVRIHLYIKDVENKCWSKPIEGLGGSKLVAKESSSMFFSDEAYKMAYTDAISVACKALGVGADVYYNKDVMSYGTKYDSYPYASASSSTGTRTPAASKNTGTPAPGTAPAAQAPQAAPAAPGAPAAAPTQMMAPNSEAWNSLLAAIKQRKMTRPQIVATIKNHNYSITSENLTRLCFEGDVAS